MSLPLNATKDRLLTRSRLIFWRDLLASQTGETVSAWVPFAEDAIATIDARDTEIAELRKERDDARLALAMARGEGWPEGWVRYESAWRAPDGRHTIELGSRITMNHAKTLWWTLRTAGGWDLSFQSFPDALAALRAYQAVKS